MDKLSDVLLFATIGPNPAPVTEAIWALLRHRQQRVVECHLVSLQRGHEYLEWEVRARGAALDQLRALPGMRRAAVIRETRVKAPGGTFVVADDDDDGAAAYRNTAWDAARTCLERAGERSVVFLLAGGRLRTSTAYATTVFQLLARPIDRLVDVRVSDRRVEGGTGFMFPEQDLRVVHTRDGAEVDATAVGVRLVDVSIPRLRTLIPPASLGSFDRARIACERSVELASPPRLHIDLTSGRARVDDAALSMSTGCLLWLTALALHRTRPGDGWLEASDTTRIQGLLKGVSRQAWVDDTLREGALAGLLGLAPASSVEKEGERLKKLRADTRRRLQAWTQDSSRRHWERWLVPEVEKRKGATWQRLPLPPERVVVVPPAR